MFRDRLKRIIPQVAEYTDGSLEGETPSLPRGLDQYAFLLRFDPRLLDGKKVLDFGCGFSNIYAELLKRRVTPAKFVAVDRNSKVKQANPQARIVDGRDLVFYFNRGEFDICLALFSTYQIGFEDRGGVFGNLLAVTGGAVHIGPVFGEDFDFLTKEACRFGYEVIVCRPFQGNPFKREIFWPSEDGDYEKFQKQYPSNERIIRPQAERPLLTLSLFGRTVDYSGGSYIVLKRLEGV